MGSNKVINDTEQELFRVLLVLSLSDKDGGIFDSGLDKVLETLTKIHKLLDTLEYWHKAPVLQFLKQSQKYNDLLAAHQQQAGGAMQKTNQTGK